MEKRKCFQWLINDIWILKREDNQLRRKKTELKGKRKKHYLNISIDRSMPSFTCWRCDASSISIGWPGSRAIAWMWALLRGCWRTGLWDSGKGRSIGFYTAGWEKREGGERTREKNNVEAATEKNHQIFKTLQWRDTLFFPKIKKNYFNYINMNCCWCCFFVLFFILFF